jgi:hypothetical protein
MMTLEALRHMQWGGSEVDMSFYGAPVEPGTFKETTKAPDAMDDRGSQRGREF